MNGTDSVRMAIDLYNSSATMVSNLWELYAIAALGLLGYLLGTKEALPGRAKLGLAIAFAVFAVSNALALFHFQAINFSAATAIDHLRFSSTGPDIQTLLSKLSSTSPWATVVLQEVYTLVAIVSIYWVHRDDRLKISV